MEKFAVCDYVRSAGVAGRGGWSTCTSLGARAPHTEVQFNSVKLSFKHRNMQLLTALACWAKCRTANWAHPQQCATRQHKTQQYRLWYWHSSFAVRGDFKIDICAFTHILVRSQTLSHRCYSNNIKYNMHRNHHMVQYICCQAVS